MEKLGIALNFPVKLYDYLPCKNISADSYKINDWYVFILEIKN
jgi:hypothetical protein